MALAQRNKKQHFDAENYGVQNSHKSCLGWRIIKGAVLITGATAGAMVAVNTLISLRTPPPDDRLGGLFDRYPGRLGDIAYTVGGDGPPVLLLHSLHPGASMAEWENNFAALCEKFTVYAFDFVGWGASDKPEADYFTPEYAEQVEFFIEDIVKQPCAIIASGQSGNAAVLAAARRPELVNNLVLVCPPLPDEPEIPVPGAGLAVGKALKLPIVGTSLYNALVSRRALSEWARRHLFFDKNQVSDSFVSGQHIATHQRGALHAARASWSGATAFNALEEWEKLTIPALLIWGRNALHPPVDTAPEWLAVKPDSHLEVIEQAMLWPHAEHAARFNRIITDWLSR